MMRIWVELRYKCQLSSEAPSVHLFSFFSLLVKVQQYCWLYILISVHKVDKGKQIIL